MPTRISRITFFLVFALTGFLFYRTLRPFLLWVGVGAVCAILTWRPYNLLAHALGGRRRLAATLTTIAVVIAVVAPLVSTGYVVIREGIDVAQRLATDPSATAPAPPAPDGAPQQGPPSPAPPRRRALAERRGESSARAAPASTPAAPSDAVGERLPRPLRGLWERLDAYLPFDAAQLRAAVESLARNAVTFLTGLVAGIGELVLGAFVWVLSLYYFYLDGRGWLDTARRLLPLPERHTTAFFHEFRAVSIAVFYGYVFCALAQGVLDGFAFWLFGIPGAVLLGAIVAILALLPILGSICVWLPAAIWLMMRGRVAAGVVLALIGFGVLLAVDYVLRPIVTRGQLEMHPLLVFLSIFGGLAAFGFAGAFLGPLFVALFLAAIRIYEADYPAPREPPRGIAQPLPVEPPPASMH